MKNSKHIIIIKYIILSLLFIALLSGLTGCTAQKYNCSGRSSWACYK